ncbi:conserved hypothetical protein [Chthoniobacter flavus Ellin428]|uniref:Transmembrane protein n=1 Tax=Chthoniobacter flavus Ellin428 TaxID=497964 RepID=B4CX83_9BACT|nr:hypothetical protein [Chthoniobacter flavus]EDY20881.1 conserved hypothetical protein [Chthoniobacter flavus Ellin428]TCO85630.1 hypothetical protein EV701_13013 [Chthoniobacter flavus]
MDQPEKDKSLEFLSGGMGIEAIAGIGTVVLAILGLAGVIPAYMTAIAAIVAGAGLLLGGASIASRLDYLRAHAANEAKFGELSEGMGGEFLAGLGGVVLGILSLIGIVPATLLPIAAIVLGGGLLVGIGAVGRLNKYPTFMEGETHTDYVARQTTSSAAGTQLLVGFASIALGILALVGFSWMTLTLVAFLCVGCATWFTGMSLGGRLQAALHHHLHHW